MRWTVRRLQPAASARCCCVQPRCWRSRLTVSALTSISGPRHVVDQPCRGGTRQHANNKIRREFPGETPCAELAGFGIDSKLALTEVIAVDQLTFAIQLDVQLAAQQRDNPEHQLVTDTGMLEMVRCDQAQAPFPGDDPVIDRDDLATGPGRTPHRDRDAIDIEEGSNALAKPDFHTRILVRHFISARRFLTATSFVTAHIVPPCEF